MSVHGAVCRDKHTLEKIASVTVITSVKTVSFPTF